ncbi:zinc finger protein 184-like isoform X1 [Ochlerotatus camptorhynchus]|uniref:zinc finger protein 184-like isoform X1 n=1 Tax=Ochlerotatus camptorhynchus TaxID=644619 RepID=UPI0031D5D99A
MANSIFRSVKRPDSCSFCMNQCTGPFRHILTITEEYEQLLKPVLLELKAPSSPPGSQGYQSCDKCRRRIISSHQIPESCFQIMPSAEVVNVKVEPDVNSECLQPTIGDDEVDEEELLQLIPETEMRVDDEFGQVLVFKGLDDRLTVEENVDIQRILGGFVEPVRIGKRGRRKKGTAPVEKSRKDRCFPIRHRCPFCNKGFADKCLMTTHIRWHTGEKPFKCEHCGKGFCENSKLKLHLRTHTGERPYPCPYCPKSFTQSITLKIHIRIHTRETPYVCDICDRGFTQSYSLTLHLRNQHNQVTIYRGREVGVLPELKCQYCGKIYRSTKSYQLHVKLHNTGKLFDCGLCGKKYTFVHKCKSDTSKPKVYPCHICGQEFKHQQSVVYHMSSKHNQFGYDMDWAEKKEPNDGEIVGS